MSSDKSKNSNIKTYTQAVKVKMGVSQLQMGMYVCELDRPWEETPFVLQGFLLKTPDHIQEVKRYCDYVYIDEIKSTQLKPSLSRQKVDTESVPKIEKVKSVGRRTSSLTLSPKEKQRKHWVEGHHFEEKDLEPAAKTYKDTSKLVKTVMQEIKLGHAIDAPAVKEAVEACVDNVIHNTDAMALMSRLRNKDEYTSEHSLNVAIISIALGRHIGLDKKELHVLGVCGLLHDMGKMLTPDQILHKPGPLSDEELIVMQQHPADGREILSSTSGISFEAVNVAHAHHERMDGNGYPQGLKGNDLSTYNRIVSIADVFDAVTGDRAYSDGTTVEAALRFLHDGRGVQFDPIIVTQFIENVGIYPLGTVVEMQNGEIGIVVNTNYEYRLRPWVKIILDMDHKPCEPRLVNLAKSELDSSGNPYWIKASHNPRNFNIDIFRHIHGQLDF